MNRPGAVFPAALILGLAASSIGAADAVDYGREVLPILSRNCFLCHGPDASTRKAGLRLDRREDAARVLDEIVMRVSTPDQDERMPPAGRARLAAADIEVLRRWIDEGAPYSAHWAWKPIRPVEPPECRDADWPRTAVDRFILDALERRGLRAAAEADRRVWIRRVSLDLTGLPPAPEAVDAFVADREPGAYERVVDRLLDSPRFGERWARHWLDLVRYAETHGHEFDYEIRHAWRYRDYVIRALNADVPYDRFVTEHIAGDLLGEPRRHPQEGFNESIIGTGFWFLGQATHAPVDVRGDEAERIDNQIDVFSKAFLGATVSCARCHDHKFDPISTEDYYALSGFLQSSRRQEAYLDPGGRIARGAAAARSIRAEGDALLAEIMATARAAGGAPVAAALRGVREVRYGEPRPGDPPMQPAPIVFDDFESGTYEGWTVSGTAFGDRPVSQETIAAYQGDVGAHGGGFVNSHQTRGGEDVGAADGHRGVMTSDVFTIERRFIHFLIGGGHHPGQTCLNLVIDGEVVRSETGRNSNRMHAARFDVTELRGRRGHLDIVDEATGGWGQIAIDHIVCSDDADPEAPRRRSPATVAAELGLDEGVLERWLDVLGDETVSEPGHPAHVWRSAAMHDRFTPPPPPERPGAATPLVAGRIDGPTIAGWSASGAAFEPAPSGPRARVADVAEEPRLALAAPGAAHSGLVAGRLQGTLRSPTFEIPARYVHYQAAGRGGRIRLVIDGYYLDDFNPLLFGGMTFDVNTNDGRAERFRQDARLYVGHRAYIEIIDDGPGWIAVDQIAFSDEPEVATTPGAMRLALGAAATSVDDLAEAYATQTRLALQAWQEDTIEADASAWLDWLIAHGLLDDPGGDHATRLAAHLERLGALNRELPEPTRVLAMTDGTPEDERVFVRGDHRSMGEVVPRRFIESIGGPDQTAIAGGSGRLELARRLLDPENPMPARVAVNRVWHHLFGRGLVPSTDDFGALGEVPTHPELLDWLAGWYRTEGGWSLKRLVRLLATSSVYRQSCTTADEAAASVDPANTLLHRMRLRRLEGEAIRDSILQVAGALDTAMYGPPVPLHLTPFMTGRGRPGASGPLDGNGRRSIYLAVRRNFLSPMMQAFDTPAPASTIGRRTVSNVPAQALTLMNDPFVLEQARVWARRVLADPATPGERLERMYREALARAPTAAEQTRALEFLRTQAAEHDAEHDAEPFADHEPAWTDLAHVLLNLKEFVFVR